MFAYSSRGSINGEIRIPGSKSETIRATLMATLADGTSVIHNALPSRDGLAALEVAKAFGAEVEVNEIAKTWTITGVNGKPKVPENVIDTWNSGTTTSFTIGISTLLEDGCVLITGDDQIRRRPWKEETDALKELGATCIHTRPGSACPPLIVHGPIHGGTAHLYGLNSQYTSAMLVPSALLPAGESVDLEVENPLEGMYVHMTMGWMKHFGVEVQNDGGYHHYHIEGGQKYKATDCFINSDWSSALFPIVAAVCTDSEVIVSGMDFYNHQADKTVVDILISMGADIEKDILGNRVVIHGGKPLHGVEIDMALIPDSLPILSVAAAYAEGDTVFKNLAHVRIKETDRVAVMEEILNSLGGDVESDSDSMTVHGGKPLTGTLVDSFSDHRIAMAMAVLGLFCDGEMKITDPECAYVSFPGFYEAMNKLGAGYEFSHESRYSF